MLYLYFVVRPNGHFNVRKHINYAYTYLKHAIVARHAFSQSHNSFDQKYNIQSCINTHLHVHILERKFMFSLNVAI